MLNMKDIKDIIESSNNDGMVHFLGIIVIDGICYCLGKKEEKDRFSYDPCEEEMLCNMSDVENNYRAIVRGLGYSLNSHLSKKENIDKHFGINSEE